MKKYIVLLLVVIISVAAFADNPVKSIKLNSTKNFDYVVLKDLGILALTTDKKEVTIYFLDQDFNLKYSHLIEQTFTTSYTYDLEIFHTEDEYYILFSPKHTLKKLNIIKGNSEKILKTAEYKWKDFADDYFFDGENIVIAFGKKGEYSHVKINKNTLSQSAPVKVDLPEVEGFNFLGVNDGQIMYYGFLKPDPKYNKLENDAIVLAYLDKSGEMIKTNSFEIAPKEGKTFLPASYSHSGGYSGPSYTYEGPSFATYLSPYNSNLYLYTYYMADDKMLYKKQGVFLTALDPDMKEPEILYEGYIQNLFGEDVTSYSEPFLLSLDENYSILIHIEQKGKLISDQRAIVTLLDSSGKVISKVNPEDKDPDESPGGLGAVPPEVHFAHSNYIPHLNDFLKYSSLNGLPFKEIMKSMDPKDIKNEDIRYSVFRQNNEWIVVQFNKDTGQLNFYKA